MAFIVQQSHPGLRQASNRELTFIQMLQITDPQIQLITADAIDNLLRGHRQQAELQRRVFLRRGLISCIGLRLASGTIPTRSWPTICPRQMAASAAAVMSGQHRPRPARSALPPG